MTDSIDDLEIPIVWQGIKGFEPNGKILRINGFVELQGVRRRCCELEHGVGVNEAC
ncbi:MAG TPA: hypothetical protein VGO47_09085 [Chlamydiales bacterium]|nr:hypothetical protein [Chlamydiales bacterium]